MARSPLVGLNTSACQARTLTVLVALLALFTVAVPTHAAPAAPLAATSYYMSSVDQTAAYNLGCSLGSRDLNTAGTQNNAAILDFGQPWQQSGAYGTYYFGGAFVSTSQIAAAAEQFARGYWVCTGSDTASTVRVVIGTSNYGSQVTSGHGQAWAQMVNDVNSWLSSNGYSSQATAAGGNDMELSWNSRAVTRAWVDGYASAYQYALYDYGDAAGCPPYGSCNNGWTLEDVWYVSWGAAPAYSIPEIYNTTGANAKQWYQISLYGATNHGSATIISGVLTQSGACQQRGGCSGVNNTPSQGWSQLWDALNADSRTAQTPTWSTDIRWQ